MLKIQFTKVLSNIENSQGNTSSKANLILLRTEFCSSYHSRSILSGLTEVILNHLRILRQMFVIKFAILRQSCEMSNLSHKINLPNQILPQEKHVNRDKFSTQNE